MFTVYTEKEIYEEICIFDDFPNWKQIIANHTDVCLDIDDESLEAELSNPDSPILLFLNAYAGAKTPVALKEYFEVIKEDLSEVLTHPTSTFILEMAEEKAQKARDEFGVAIFSKSNLQDDYFIHGFFKEIRKGETIPDGWKTLVDIDLPVSNALIISDNYLFKNEENGKNCGLANLPSLLDVFLPANLSVDFHITVIATDGGKSRKWWIQKAGALKAQITNLRSYDINFELILANTIHKRRILSNYLNGWVDKGFSIFRSNDSESVRTDNDIHLYRIFNNLNPRGDSHSQSLNKGLTDIKKICVNIAQYIENNGETGDYMIFGDCNRNKTVKNRLLK